MEKITNAILDQTINRANVLMFDLDGTLVDTNYANFLSYIDAIQQVAKLDIDISYDLNERFTRKILKKVIPSLYETEHEKIIKLKNELYIKYLDQTKLNYSVVEILEKYSNTKKIILVTNSHEERASMTLKYHGLIDKFTHKFYKQEAQINKYEYALTSLKIPPTSVFIFENERSEINAAIQAGIPFENIISINS